MSFQRDSTGDAKWFNALTHQRLRRRSLASLFEDEITRLKHASIISEQKRSLQNESSCVSNNVYESIRTTIDDMANSIADLGDGGHFMGRDCEACCSKK